jgi:hypothetical protein
MQRPGTTFQPGRIYSPATLQLVADLTDLHKKKVQALASAVQILESNPAAADLPICEKEASGNCIAKRPSKSAPGRPAGAVTLANLPAIERKIALLIGVGDYRGSSPKLDSPVKDVQEIGKLYGEQFGYEVRTLPNADKATIVRALNRLILETGPHDSVTVFYAGHGHVVQKTGRGYWIPARASADDPTQWISNADIAKALQNIPANQVLLVSDSCYSGTLTREGKIQKSELLPDPAAILERRSVTVLSSGGEEPVADAGKDGHSVFAWHFMQTLKTVQQWSNGIDVYQQVADAVNKDFPQEPQYGAALGAGHETGADFLFEVRRQ